MLREYLQRDCIQMPYDCVGAGIHEKNVQTWFKAFQKTFNKHYLPLNDEWQSYCLIVEVVQFLSMEGQL